MSYSHSDVTNSAQRSRFNPLIGPDDVPLSHSDPYRALVATSPRIPDLDAPGSTPGNIDIHIHAILTPLRSQANTVLADTLDSAPVGTLTVPNQNANAGIAPTRSTPLGGSQNILDSHSANEDESWATDVLAGRVGANEDESCTSYEREIVESTMPATQTQGETTEAAASYTGQSYVESAASYLRNAVSYWL